MSSLIVCEGSKTEPHYLSELREMWGIPHAWVSIKPSEGSSPVRVVQTAEKLYAQDAQMGDSFDQVFCVFDRDAHATFSAAVQRTRELKVNRKPFQAITSTPCFEFWFLLHFGYSDAPFAKAEKKDRWATWWSANSKPKRVWRNMAKAKKVYLRRCKISWHLQPNTPPSCESPQRKSKTKTGKSTPTLGPMWMNCCSTSKA
jgi:hypothetical protein